MKLITLLAVVILFSCNSVRNDNSVVDAPSQPPDNSEINTTIETDTLYNSFIKHFKNLNYPLQFPFNKQSRGEKLDSLFNYFTNEAINNTNNQPPRNHSIGKIFTDSAANFDALIYFQNLPPSIHWNTFLAVYNKDGKILSKLIIGGTDNVSYSITSTILNKDSIVVKSVYDLSVNAEPMYKEPYTDLNEVKEVYALTQSGNIILKSRQTQKFVGRRATSGKGLFEYPVKLPNNTSTR